MVGAILGSVLQSVLAPSVQSKFKQFQQEFQKIGQDLQTGNLVQARTDFAALQQNSPIAVPSTGTIGSVTTAIGSPIARQFYELAQDLTAGNLAAAQQVYGALQQDFQRFTSGGSVNARA
jgi:hypothetical protein